MPETLRAVQEERQNNLSKSPMYGISMNRTHLFEHLFGSPFPSANRFAPV